MSTGASSNTSIVRGSTPLSWLVFGCGAVGGYFGGRLAQSGAKVTFVARAATYNALQSRLQVESIAGDFNIKSPSVLNSEKMTNKSFDHPVVDVVILGTKTFQAVEALKICEPLIGESTVILPLQNGALILDDIFHLVQY